MIEHLSGTLLEKSPTHLVLQCGGVGYGVLISLATYERMPESGEQASLYAYLAVREDAMTLYGFAERSEREMFLQLTSVSGIGPKIAIGVLSGAGADALREYIVDGNIPALQRLPGIGKKTAERISLELRDKVTATGSTLGTSAGDDPRAGVRAEALDALVALGFGRGVSEKAIRSALKNDSAADASVEVLIKAALKNA